VVRHKVSENGKYPQIDPRVRWSMDSQIHAHHVSRPVIDRFGLGYAAPVSAG
jgi:hypothetical protein